MGEDEKKSGLTAQIIVPVAIALLAGGSAPWWWNAVRGEKAGPSSTRADAETVSVDQPVSSVAVVQTANSTPSPAASDDDIARQVRKIIADLLGKNVGEVVDSARLSEDLNADSLDTVELIMAMEEAFTIQIPDQDACGFVTVGQAIAYARSHVAR